MNRSLRAAAPVFLLGLVAGAALGSWGQRALFRRFQRRGPDPARVLERLTRELRLDEDQRDRVAEIMDRRRPELQALKRDAKARFDAIREESDAEIRAILRPGQREAFDRMTARWRERLRARDVPGGPPGPPPPGL